MTQPTPPDMIGAGAFMKGLKELAIPYGLKFAYAWIVFEYGYNRWIPREALENYCSRRQSFRIVKALEEKDMIEVEYRNRFKKYIKAV